MRSFLAALCVACAATAALAHDERNPAQGVAIEQRVGARLPADLAFRDDEGRSVTLAQALGDGPAVLVMGYAHCKDLCPVTLAGLVQALEAGGLTPGHDYRAVFVSVDPADGVADLAQMKAGRIPLAERGAWSFLSGSNAVPVAAALGYHFRRDDELDTIVHAAGFAVVTSGGTVSRYFPGVRFDPRELRVALTQAGEGGTGGVVNQLLLLCAHLDPSVGRHSGLILVVLRIAATLFLAAFAAWGWVRLGGRIL
jgi:protein SCO1/2